MTVGQLKSLLDKCGNDEANVEYHISDKIFLHDEYGETIASFKNHSAGNINYAALRSTYGHETFVVSNLGLEDRG